MGEVIVVSGPPGSGKSTVANLLAERYEPSALVDGDAFFAFLRTGFVAPWLPESDHQNRAVLAAAAAASGRLAEHCTVVYDGVLWPPYVPLFAANADRPIHYAVLLPSVDTLLQRVRDRVDHPFTDLTAAEHMWHSFAEASEGLPTIDPVGSPADVADIIVGLVASGAIRRD